MPERYEFDGFSLPTYTQVPDELFDRLIPHLADPELRVLLYIVRRTFGFKKEADAISLRQMVEGITTAEGRVLDMGTGMSKSSVQRGLKGLREKGVIVVQHNRTSERGNEPTTYRLRLRGEPKSVSDTPLWSVVNQGVGSALTIPSGQLGPPQETVEQQTVQQETDFEISNGRASQKLGKTNDEAPRPLTLEELAAWDERLRQQEQHLNHLRSKPKP